MSDIYTLAELKKMKIAELKKLLKERGLSTSGNKSNLLERLTNAADASLGSPDKESLEDDSVLDDTTDIVAEDTESTDVPELAVPVTVDKQVKTVLAKPTSTSTQPVKTQPVARQPASTGMNARLKRFGIVSEQARKAARLERFERASSSSSTVVTVGRNTLSVAGGADMMKKRAERFGTSASTASSTAVTLPGSNVDMLKKRAERFGEVTSSKLGKVDEQDRVSKRKARFGTITAPSDSLTATEQKKRRLERFGTAVAV